MILFAWRRLTPPVFIGGAELTEVAIAEEYVDCGRQVVMVGSYQNPRNVLHSSLDELLKFLDACSIDYNFRNGTLRYEWRGIECLCTSQDRLPDLVAEFATRCEIMWTSQEGSDLLARGTPSTKLATYIHSVSAVGLVSLAAKPRWVFAPSHFVAEWLARVGQPNATLLRPKYRLYSTEARPPHSFDSLLFVNPIKDKGVELVMSLVERLPSYTFNFVEGWFPPTKQWQSHLPSNVTYWPRTLDMTSHYLHNALLLAPSVVQDAAPRVIMEAASCGRPTIGSAVGGIPELIADSHHVIDHRDVETWQNRILELTSNPSLYSRTARRQGQLAESLYPNTKAILRRVGAM